MLEISDALIRATVSPNALAAAQAYVRAGRVRGFKADPDKGLITGKVQGSARTPYAQTITFEHTRSGGWEISGDCTCPVGYNCKHVAAILLAQRMAAPAQNGFAMAEPANTRALQVSQPAMLAEKQSFSLSAAPKPAASPAPKPAAKDAEPGLPPALAAWMRELASDAAADSDEYPEGISKRLYYALAAHVPFGARVPQLQVLPTAADLKKDGSISTTHSLPSVQQLLHGPTAPKYLRPADRTNLRNLLDETLDERQGDPATALRLILATGRARVGAFPGLPAREGQPRDGKLDWELEEDGSQRPLLSVNGGGETVLLPAPWYIDTTTGELGPLNIDIPLTMLKRLLNAPPVAPAQAAAVRAALAKTLPGITLPAPRELPHGGKLGGKPKPHATLRKLPSWNYNDLETRFAGAELTPSFRYNGVLVPPGQQDSDIVHKGTRYELVRDEAAEAAARAVLKKMGFVPLREALPWGSVPGDRDRMVLRGNNPLNSWLDFMMDGVPALRAQGWEIDVAADFPHKMVSATGPMLAEMREGSGIDWFELDLGVVVGEERIDLAPALANLLTNPANAEMLQALRGEKKIEAGRKIILSLMDGRRVALELAQIAPVLLTLLDLFRSGAIEDENGKLTVSRHSAVDMAALEKAGLAAGMVWRGGEALRGLGRLLQDRGGITAVKIPKWFNADLRPYQQRGVDWLQFLREAGLAGVLADDMGLGKTVQTLAHLAVEKQKKRLNAPALVICPTSVVGNWAREAERFAPRLRVLPLQGNDRKTRFEEIPDHDIVISTYPLLTRDEDVLTGQEWHSVILDEAQTVKNPAASMAGIVRRLRAGQRICLTGTPMENHLGELWALFDFMMPGFLGSQRDFATRFRTPVEKHGDVEVHETLAKRVAPFLLRRTKSEVASDLPPRTDIVENIQMQPPQRAVYEAIRLAMHAKVQAAIAEQGLARSGIVILDALLKMRQACCDPRLLKIAGTTKSKAGSAKLDRLLELMTTLLDEGRSILLFSQFTSMLTLIEESVKPLGIPYVTLTGDTKDRRTPVDKFQAGKVKLFLVSLKAGGVGLNLTAADTVIHYDPWWNPAVENQATDRAHRIGQKKAVFVHRLITENSIEEKMEVLKSRKSALADGILSGAGASALKMTQDDVEMLFG